MEAALKSTTGRELNILDVDYRTGIHNLFTAAIPKSDIKLFSNQ